VLCGNIGPFFLVPIDVNLIQVSPPTYIPIGHGEEEEPDGRDEEAGRDG